MFCQRQTNNMINKLHKRVLKIALNDQTCNFEKLFAESSDICNHQRKIQKLLIEVYKIQNNLPLH